MDIIQSSGVFIYPLGLCYLLAVYLIVERLFSLRRARTVPAYVRHQIVTGEFDKEDYSDESVAGQVINFFRESTPDADALKAFGRYHVARLERGIYILDIIVGAAPLLGLLGTVVGLIQVFSGIDPTSAMPDPANLVQGIALALTTTMLGLLIAIPALAASRYLNRKIDVVCSYLDVLMERLLDPKK